MSLTNIPAGDARAISLQSVGLYAAVFQRLNLINQLAGPMPQLADASKRLRYESDKTMPIVRCMDLSKQAGEEVSIDLILPVSGKPFMGATNVEGKGAAMEFSTFSMRINQTRFPISAGDTMSQQRTVHDLRKLAMDQGYGYFKALADQRATIHLAGARGTLNNIAWKVPLASDADFSSIMVNTVKCPTRNRHLVADATNGIDDAAGALGGASFASGDTMDLGVIDAIRAYVDGMALPPPPIMVPGDPAAMDSPLYMLLVSPAQYESIKTSDSNAFRTFQANAYARASAAKNHPLFTGEVGIWNNILVRKMPYPIRFSSGDTVKYAASYTTETESDYTASFSVDRALLLGGQALVEAWGKSKKSGQPFYVSEKELDHGDKTEIAYGEISGCSKARFVIDHGDGNGEAYTDMGVMAIDTAVVLPT